MNIKLIKPIEAENQRTDLYETAIEAQVPLSKHL